MEKSDSIVIIKRFPFATAENEIFPMEREKEINACKSEKSKNEKFYVWMLLQDSLRYFFDIDITKANIKKQDNGKWTSDLFNFSLSHSKNLAAVAISLKNEIGIDIQEKKKIDISGMIRNEDDVKVNDDILFSIKEAIYKSKNSGNFVPKDIKTNKESFYVFDILSNKDKYVLSVCTKENISLFVDSDIQFKIKNVR